jgi:acyl-CoA synthetase (AMP-forming)/AMP-acid ligase II
MFDLGRTFLASVERSPDALAVVDGARRLSYAQWGREIASLTAGLMSLGLKRGDRLAVILQNRLEMASLHWACQLAGIVVTPLNWRIKAGELDYCLSDAEARGVVFDPIAADAVSRAGVARTLQRIAVGGAKGGSCRFTELTGGAADLMPCAGPEDLSVLLYTSGTTGRPKGVPRRHSAERAAALAHVAQNLYGRGERTLGVMPLYHTMGVRSLLATTLIDGAFICLPRFDPAAALRLIADEQITNLYLVPTLYHDLVSHPGFATSDASASSVLPARPCPTACCSGLRRRSSQNCSSIITARRRSTPSRSSRGPLPSRARPVRPGSTSVFVLSSSAHPRLTRSQHPAKKERSSPIWRGRRRSTAIGGGPTLTPAPFAVAGTSQATLAISTLRATCS